MDAMKLGETLWMVHLEHVRVLEQVVDRSSVRGENGVLLYLYHIARPMFPGELTEKLGLTTGRIANILRELEGDGLIVRTPDAEDKRRVRVSLTHRGEALARMRNQQAVACHARVISKMTPDEAQRFLDMFARVVTILEEDASEDGTAR